MVRDAAEAKGRDRFACSLLVWDLLQELGEEFGWAPHGSTYVPHPSKKFDAPAGHDYQPGDSQDLKHIEAHDAIAWANALQAAIASPRLDEFLKTRVATDAPRDSLISIVKEFIQYCYGGAFVFSLK